jgi:hypothetical protein
MSNHCSPVNSDTEAEVTMKYHTGTRDYRYVVLSILVIMVVVGYVLIAFAQSSHYDELANAPFAETRPTPETAKLLSETYSSNEGRRRISGSCL